MATQKLTCSRNALRPFAIAISLLAAVLARAECSEGEHALRAKYYGVGIQALRAQDIDAYYDSERRLLEQLSPSCQEATSRHQPVRRLCDADEKITILRSYRNGARAIKQNDLAAMLTIMIDLEESVSERCWIASNYPIDPRLHDACTSADLNRLARAGGEYFQVLNEVLSTLDNSPAREFERNLLGSLSQQCIQVTAQIMEEAGAQTSQASSSASSHSLGSGLGTVQEHGDGAYSVPGLGYCSSSGCIAF